MIIYMKTDENLLFSNNWNFEVFLGIIIKFLVIMVIET